MATGTVSATGTGGCVQCLCNAAHTSSGLAVTVLVLLQDYNNLDVDAATFLRSGRKLYFLACDRGQSCHLFCYDPSQPQSYQGKRLIAV